MRKGTKHGWVVLISGIIFSPAACVKRHRTVTMGISGKCFKVKADGWLVKKNNCTGWKVGLHVRRGERRIYKEDDGK